MVPPTRALLQTWSPLISSANGLLTWPADRIILWFSLKMGRFMPGGRIIVVKLGPDRPQTNRHQEKWLQALDPAKLCPFRVGRSRRWQFWTMGRFMAGDTMEMDSWVWARTQISPIHAESRIWMESSFKKLLAVMLTLWSYLMTDPYTHSAPTLMANWALEVKPIRSRPLRSHTTWGDSWKSRPRTTTTFPLLWPKTESVSCGVSAGGSPSLNPQRPPFSLCMMFLHVSVPPQSRGGQWNWVHVK